jgi:23S rRNA pseudouridine1911/1915/1917 synthase
MEKIGSAQKDKKAPTGFAEMRLDKYLVEKIADVSRAKIQKAIRDGRVSVNGTIVLEPDFDIKDSDNVSLPQFESDDLKPSDLKLNIVYDNADLAVIDKPAGLVVHPGAGNTEDTLSNALLTYFPQIKDVGQPHRPGIVHRLDEDTSGLIIIAKTDAAYDYLKKSFEDRTIDKEYLALVHGTLKNLHGTIDLALEKVPMKQKMKVGSGKQALTEYFLEDSDPTGQFSLIRVKLHTGRTHQIRAHMQAIGHPLVCDKVYGGEFKQSDAQIIGRQFLHAYRLKFKLMDGTTLELTSPIPSDLQEVLSKLRIKYDKFI